MVLNTMEKILFVPMRTDVNATRPTGYALPGISLTVVSIVSPTAPSIIIPIQFDIAGAALSLISEVQ
jgi:hypothetical protein